jgi:2-oxoisovalerate dehydrogenase E1 component
MTKDLYEPKDGAWLFPFPAPGEAVDFGAERVYHPEHEDLAILTYANGVHLSLRAARVLEREHGIRARVVDLRWLQPLNVEAIARHARECEGVLIVDEGRRSGGLSEQIITALVEHGDPVPRVARVVGEDSYIPIGPAALAVLPSEGDVVEAARKLVRKVAPPA